MVTRKREDNRMVRMRPVAHGFFLEIAGKNQLRVWEAVELVVDLAKRAMVEDGDGGVALAQKPRMVEVELKGGKRATLAEDQVERYVIAGQARCSKCHLWHMVGCDCSERYVR